MAIHISKHVKLAGTAAISAIPYIGGPLSNIINSFVVDDAIGDVEDKIDQINQFIESLAMDMKTIESGVNSNKLMLGNLVEDKLVEVLKIIISSNDTSQVKLRRNKLLRSIRENVMSHKEIINLIQKEAYVLQHNLAGRPHILKMLMNFDSFIRDYLDPISVSIEDLEDRLSELLSKIPRKPTRPKDINLTNSAFGIINEAVNMQIAKADVDNTGRLWMALRIHSYNLMEWRASIGPSAREWISFLEKVPPLMQTIRTDTPYMNNEWRND